MIIHKFRHILQLIFIYGLLMAIGYGIITYTGFALKIQTFSLLLTLMTLITLGAYLLIMISKKKDEKAQGIFLLAGLGGKFLLYLILILIFWSNGNNLTKEFIIVFFVLYLLLTIYLISVLYKVLKIK